VIFTSWAYVAFLAIVFALYWACRQRGIQNALLLLGSYLFYGWIHPWFCLLVASSTIVDYFCALGMERHPARKRLFLVASLTCNLGLLGFFKYSGFLADNLQAALTSVGLGLDPFAFQVLLPVGISFYTFQTLSYTIDVYRGVLRARTSLLDVALFVAFFPQLVAGPIERAKRFLPQLERRRVWSGAVFRSAWPLLVRGYLKKLVVADNVAVFVDKVFLLEEPSLLLLFAGALAFALQILADFSAYTDIARGSARLLGFELVRNFDTPYLAISPSDFWRRWHISFSSWIRDYLYIPLGGSRVDTGWAFAGVLALTMGLSGLWHGAAWHFVTWGLYHGALVFAYHRLGLGGRWRPSGRLATAVAWGAMSGFTLFGWLIFRAPSLGWLAGALSAASAGLGGDELAAACSVLAFVALYALPLVAFLVADRAAPRAGWAHSVLHGAALAVTVFFFRESGQDFIYFQF
jgi:D-alanyl-lipoteichoic acid acyltransferase DltB (MBOAT superfamily)